MTPSGNETAVQAPVPLTATYVLVSSDCMDDAARLVSRLADPCHGTGPIQLCRQLSEGLAAADIPLAPAENLGHGALVEEVWHGSISWLGHMLGTGFEPQLASRLVIRLPWPLSPEVELTVLEARLSAPGLRFAVPVTAAVGEEIFLYFNRLQCPWIGLPADGQTLGDWSDALARLGRLWCLDPTTQTPMEPLQTAFARILATRLGQSFAPWRYRVMDVKGAVALDAAVWTPSAHALLVSTGWEALTKPLASLPVIDQGWLAPLERIGASVNADRLRELFHPVATATGAGEQS
jgi:hypothetical protein